MNLSKPLRNMLFESLGQHASSLDPADFRWTSDADVDTLTYRPTGDHMWFGPGPVPSPASPILRERETRPNIGFVIEGTSHHTDAHQLEELESMFRVWLEAVANHKAEIDLPDLWAEVGAYTSDEDGVPNSLFTEDEQVEIGAKLDELLAKVEEQGRLSASELKELGRRFDYLKEAAGRMGRLDWRNLVAGALVTAITDALLPPEETRHVLTEVITSFGHMYMSRMFPQLPSGG